MNSVFQNERPSLEPRWLLPTIDVVLVFIAFVLSYYLRYELQIIRPVLDPVQRGLSPYLPFILLFALILLIQYQRAGLYRNLRGRKWSEETYIILQSVAIATVILLAFFFFFQPTVTSRLMLIYLAALTVLFHSTARLIRGFILSYLRNRGVGIQRVLIVGMGEAGQAVLGTMLAHSALGYKPVGYLDDDEDKANGDIGRVKGLGKISNLKEQIRECNADLVVITIRWTNYNKIQELVEICRQARVEIRMVPDMFQLNMKQVQVENLDGIPLLGVGQNKPFGGMSRFLKRAMDITLVVITAPVWLIIYGLTALAINLESDGDILYRHKRVGENGKEFEMYKFRSMYPNADQEHDRLVLESGEDPRHPKIKDDPRITRVGKFIRRVSLDELPNLINVLRGEMSLVGPRPPTPGEVALYQPWHMQRLNIIPGMTGLWQASGRSDIPFEEMCLLDIYYVENQSVGFDLQILFMTIPRVLLRRGAY